LEERVNPFSQDADARLIDLESKIAGWVRQYIRASNSADAAGDDESLRWLCSGLEWILGALLETKDGWDGWCDGIDPATDVLLKPIKIASAVELSVRGRATWYGNRGCWIDPFFATVRISETADQIASYDIRFGDTSRGLANFPYGKHTRYESWYFPAEWLFTFVKPII